MSSVALTGFVHFALWAQTSGFANTSAMAAGETSTEHVVDHYTETKDASGDRPAEKRSDRIQARAATDEDSQDQLLPGEDPQNKLIRPFVMHLASDQRAFWTAPAHFRTRDLRWIIPLAGTTAGFVASDSWISKQIPISNTKASKTLSDYSVYSLIAASGGAFLLGHVKGNDKMAEAGLLGGEAAINSTAVAFLLQDATQRPRPYQDNGSGTFFQGGNSFPSEHAAIAWSVASVWAHEYPSTVSQSLAYGLASAVTVTRVTGKEHFASEVIIGSALGWYFGREVYRAHHENDLGGAPWGNPFAADTPEERPRNPQNMGSSDIDMDSWIYPAFDRLIALGYIKSAYIGIRPWTRMECARLLEDAEEHTETRETVNREANQLLSALELEFTQESHRLDGVANLGASVDSVYARTMFISGAPLRDGYHFGQTIINDYGRPYGEGLNAIAGINARMEAGPLSVMVQGEYQRAPAVASDSAAVLDATAVVDWTQPLSNGTPQINRLRLLQGAIAITHDNVQISFGQQSLWLGPGGVGPFLFSNNAEPMTMLRIRAVSPYEVPLLSHLLGPVESEFFLGRLSGQRWESSFGPNLSSQPFLHGTKLSFHPTQNLELGMGFTAQLGGTGNPFTWGNFLRTFYSHRVGANKNPGKRLSEFDLTYRPPGVRDWVQMYIDAMVIDEYSPIGSNRPAINPGIYFPQIPRLNKMDLRLEGVTTDLNVPAGFGPGAFYWDDRYHSGYTNNGNLIGNWVGRRGRGEEGWLTYHFSPRSDLQLGYRHNNADRAFLGGGGLRDLILRSDVMLTRGLSVSGAIQQENWHFPVLYAMAKSNIMASFQLTFWPKRD